LIGLRFGEYWINRPLFDKNQELKQELEKVKQERAIQVRIRTRENLEKEGRRI
jgi:hypothetical protein